MTDLQLATFHVSDLLLGLPVAAVAEVLRAQHVTPVPLAPGAVSGLLNLRGRIVTAVDVRVRLGLPPRPSDLAGVHVVLGSSDEPSSLVVDEVGDVVVVAARDREDVPETVAPALRRLVTGAFQREASLLLVLDPDLMLDL